MIKGKVVHFQKSFRNPNILDRKISKLEKLRRGCSFVVLFFAYCQQKQIFFVAVVLLRYSLQLLA